MQLWKEKNGNFFSVTGIMAYDQLMKGLVKKKIEKTSY